MPKETSGNNHPSSEEQRWRRKCLEKIANLQDSFNNFFTPSRGETPNSELPEAPPEKNNTPTSGVS